MTWVQVCESSEIKGNSLQKFNIRGKDTLVGRRNGELFACDNSCPHKKAPLHRGYFNEDNIVCYLHQYEFDIKSGKLVNMASRKKSNTWKEQNPAWRRTGDLVLYDVEEKDDHVYVKIEGNNNKQKS